MRDYHKGSMKIRLHGEKLNGEFAIVKLKGREENSWLLIKHRDEYATDEDVTLLDASVVSGKTIEDLAEDPKAKTWKTFHQDPAWRLLPFVPSNRECPVLNENKENSTFRFNPKDQGSLRTSHEPRSDATDGRVQRCGLFLRIG